MECYTDFIVPRSTCNGPNPVQPKSRLYVDDLPGFSTIALANIEPGKYGTAAEMITEKLRVACERVMEDVGESVGEYVREKAPLEAGTIGEFGTSTSSSANARGLRLKMDSGVGLLTKMLISRVWLKATADKEGVVVTVKDGLKTKTFTVDVLADKEVPLDIEYVAEQNQVDITITDEEVTVYEASTEDARYFASCASCTSGAAFKYMVGCGVDDDTESATTSFGIRAEVQATCVFVAAQCLLLQEYRWAILYQFGIECLEEWTITGRMNFLGIHGKPWAEGKKVEWAAKVADIINKKSHKTANFLARLSPRCVKCGTGTTYGHSL